MPSLLYRTRRNNPLVLQRDKCVQIYSQERVNKIKFIVKDKVYYCLHLRQSSLNMVNHLSNMNLHKFIRPNKQNLCVL